MDFIFHCFIIFISYTHNTSKTKTLNKNLKKDKNKNHLSELLSVPFKKFEMV